MLKPTQFQNKLYEIVRKIPKGKTMSYKEIALKLNTSPRAVGQALKRNPYAPEIPCHRVINHDGSLGGYCGKMNSIKKKKLLKSEGVEIEY
jgi:methylated-DNA-[protein]-cysteine S-methyltransferase